MKALDKVSKSVEHLVKRNSPVVVIEKSNNFSFTFFIIGALVGAIAALLYTPDTGENNRRFITDKFKDLNQEEINFNGRQSYKVKDLTKEGAESLERARQNIKNS